MKNDFLVDSEYLSKTALEKKHRLETDPSARTNHMEYMPDMEQISPEIRQKVTDEMRDYDYAKYTSKDVVSALKRDHVTVEDFKALLSPAAEPHLEEMARRARIETGKHFGNTVYLFTPLYIANYCENYCIYCGFNCYNHIKRMKLNYEQIEREMKIIADSGMEEILILTGESRAKSSVEYIGEACKLARKYFRMVGLEVYPMNSEDYKYLHECGADYVTVFQETYDSDAYEKLHLMGHKRVWPYRFEAQERALIGGMRGVAFSALLGLSDFRKDALATGLHLYYLQRKYPQAEMSLSCPRLRPIVNNDKINPLDVGEKQLCQILCAYRIFLPYAGITVSTRESASFRNGIVKICATKISAGVSTGIGDHDEKYAAYGENDETSKNCSAEEKSNAKETAAIADESKAVTQDEMNKNKINAKTKTLQSNINCRNSDKKCEHETVVNNPDLDIKETFKDDSKNKTSATKETGDEQFEIADTRSLNKVYSDMMEEGLQPVLNDYLYV